MLDAAFWKGRRVFLTGHTGFKGSWLCLWLHSLGAEVTGYALDPPTDPSLFVLCGIESLVHSNIADVRDRERLTSIMSEVSPEIVIHMAAQPLVRDSYKVPVETYTTNVMGTVNLLEAVRRTLSIRAVINVTTDKCYENREWLWGYREDEPLGGYDPYSSSKACSELVTSAYRQSFFNPERYDEHKVAIATARAGNVVGGGDWAADRLIPDCVRAFERNETVLIRNPEAVRPWQHVLEPLHGYLILAEKLFDGGPQYGDAWNFGPPDEDAKPVNWLVEKLCLGWGQGAKFETDKSAHPHEARFLKLDTTKARSLLGWRPIWTLSVAIEKINEFNDAFRNAEDIGAVCLRQITEYQNSGEEVAIGC